MLNAHHVCTGSDCVLIVQLGRHGNADVVRINVVSCHMEVGARAAHSARFVLVR